MDVTVEVEDLAVTYRGLGSKPVTALAGVSLRAHAGEIVGVLGENGSGKSTLLAVLAGAITPTAGRARVLGRPPEDRSLLRLVGYQPEGPLPFPSCRPAEFLARLAALHGEPFAQSRERIAALLAQVGLEGALRRKVGKLSTGMARRLALAAALLPQPRVLLLDEPTSGLDPEGSLLAIELLRTQARAGTTVVLASHHLQEVEQICTRIVMLHRGRKTAEGSLDELLGTHDLEFVVEGLPGEQVPAAARALEALGGRVVHVGPRREHLFALFRRLRGSEPG